MHPFQTECDMPDSVRGPRSDGELWGGRLRGQVPATFCSGLPNDAFGERHGGQTKQGRKRLVCKRHGKHP